MKVKAVNGQLVREIVLAVELIAPATQGSRSCDLAVGCRAGPCIGKAAVASEGSVVAAAPNSDRYRFAVKVKGVCLVAILLGMNRYQKPSTGVPTRRRFVSPYEVAPPASVVAKTCFCFP